MRLTDLFPELDLLATNRQRRDMLYRAYRDFWGRLSSSRPSMKIILIYTPVLFMVVVLSLFLAGGLIFSLPATGGPPAVQVALALILASIFFLILVSTLTALALLTPLFFFWRFFRSKVRAAVYSQGIDICTDCGYDLRGQIDNRCPECGAPFVKWADRTEDDFDLLGFPAEIEVCPELWGFGPPVNDQYRALARAHAEVDYGWRKWAAPGTLLVLAFAVGAVAAIALITAGQGKIAGPIAFGGVALANLAQWWRARRADWKLQRVRASLHRQLAESGYLICSKCRVPYPPKDGPTCRNCGGQMQALTPAGQLVPLSH